MRDRCTRRKDNANDFITGDSRWDEQMVFDLVKIGMYFCKDAFFIFIRGTLENKTIDNRSPEESPRAVSKMVEKNPGGNSSRQFRVWVVFAQLNKVLETRIKMGQLSLSIFFVLCFIVIFSLN